MPLVFVDLLHRVPRRDKRAPFDLPEAESELVAGFHTEYSGMRFSIFFLAEYVAMYVVSRYRGLPLPGRWHTGIGPLDHMLEGARGGWGGAEPSLAASIAGNALGFGVLFGKAWVLIFVQMWLRWTLPRIRLDQVMDFCLKFLLPASVLFFVVSCGWEVIPWATLCKGIPVLGEKLGDRIPRVVVFLVCGGLTGLWVRWFFTQFQTPFKKNVQDKPWLVALK